MLETRKQKIKKMVSTTIRLSEKETEDRVSDFGYILQFKSCNTVLEVPISLIII